jgi:hypothetical protein
MFVAISWKQRCTRPSWREKRALLTAIRLAEEVCWSVAHRQAVLTIPKRLRLHTASTGSCWLSSARAPGRAPSLKSSVCSAGTMRRPAWSLQYMTRCRFSLSQLVEMTQTGQVIHEAEKEACRASPEPQDDGLATGPKRNRHILAPLGLPFQAVWDSAAAPLRLEVRQNLRQNLGVFDCGSTVTPRMPK